MQRVIQAGVDVIIFGDDYADKNSPLMSPRHFKEFILPGLKRCVNAAHAAGAFVIKHTDGNIMPILDMIVETGIDGLNPLEPPAGMDIGLIKQRYGKRIALIGNIDCGYLLSQAPVAEVRKVTRETMQIAMPGGGYCLSSSNSIHSSVKPENFMAMIETWRECRDYSCFPLTRNDSAAEPSSVQGVDGEKTPGSRAGIRRVGSPVPNQSEGERGHMVGFPDPASAAESPRALSLKQQAPASRNGRMTLILDGTLKLLIALALLGELGIVFCNVLSRWFTGSSFVWTLEAAELALATIAFCGRGLRLPAGGARLHLHPSRRPAARKCDEPVTRWSSSWSSRSRSRLG